MKKKILYLITKSNWGGAQRYVFDTATAMKERGFDVVVALGGEGILKQKLDSSGIRTISISELSRDMSFSKDTGSFAQIYSIIKTERPDILHLNSPKAAGLGALAGRLLGIKKIVYTVHGWAFNEDRPLWQKISIALASWITMLLCHKIILISEKELAQTSRFPLIKNKLELIPLGIKKPEFIKASEARKKISERILFDISNKIVIGTIAELHPNKGLSYLVEAMAEVAKKLPNTICVIIGDGQERASLESQTLQMGLKVNVFLAGYTKNASQYLKAFDIFVLPSLKEGLPYVLLEAGHAGLPVVATHIGGIPEIIEDKITGLLVALKNTAVLRDALLHFIENPTVGAHTGKALKEKATKKFSFETMVSKIATLYQEKARA